MGLRHAPLGSSMRKSTPICRALEGATKFRYFSHIVSWDGMSVAGGKRHQGPWGSRWVAMRSCRVGMSSRRLRSTRNLLVWSRGHLDRRHSPPRTRSCLVLLRRCAAWRRSREQRQCRLQAHVAYVSHRQREPSVSRAQINGRHALGQSRTRQYTSGVGPQCLPPGPIWHLRSFKEAGWWIGHRSCDRTPPGVKVVKAVLRTAKSNAAREVYLFVGSWGQGSRSEIDAKSRTQIAIQRDHNGHGLAGRARKGFTRRSANSKAAITSYQRCSATQSTRGRAVGSDHARRVARVQ